MIGSAILSSCSGRIQHEYVTREGWYHRRPNVGTGRGHYHRQRTLSKFSWVKDDQGEYEDYKEGSE